MKKLLCLSLIFCSLTSYSQVTLDDVKEKKIKEKKIKEFNNNSKLTHWFSVSSGFMFPALNESFTDTLYNFNIQNTSRVFPIELNYKLNIKANDHLFFSIEPGLITLFSYYNTVYSVLNTDDIFYRKIKTVNFRPHIPITANLSLKKFIYNLGFDFWVIPYAYFNKTINDQTYQGLNFIDESYSSGILFERDYAVISFETSVLIKLNSRNQLGIKFSKAFSLVNFNLDNNILQLKYNIRIK